MANSKTYLVNNFALIFCSSDKSIAISRTGRYFSGTRNISLSTGRAIDKTRTDEINYNSTNTQSLTQL